MCVFRRENQRLQNDLKLKRNHLHQNGHSHNSSSGAPALEKLEDKDEVLGSFLTIPVKPQFSENHLSA